MVHDGVNMMSQGAAGTVSTQCTAEPSGRCSVRKAVVVSEQLRHLAGLCRTFASERSHRFEPIRSWVTHNAESGRVDHADTLQYSQDQCLVSVWVW
jgi:hypothetical protein